MIHDVRVTPLKQVVDSRGKIMHMLRSDSPVFSGFGEVYFSCVNPGAVKAWHFHKRMVLNYAVPVGKIMLVLYDHRRGSPTRGHIQEIVLGEDHYCLVTIPPQIWNGFKGYGKGLSVVANCTSFPYDPGEIKRLDASRNPIPYQWFPQAK